MNRNNEMNTITIGESLLLHEVNTEVFIPYYAEHFGEKYYDHFYRNASTWQGRAEYLQNAYMISLADEMVGGVIIKDNMMTGLFTISPYGDYDFLATQLIKHLRSKTELAITVEEVPEDHKSVFFKMGFEVELSDTYMIRETESRMSTLSEGYEAQAIDESHVDDMVAVIMAAYQNNPCYKDIDDIEGYQAHINFFLEHTKEYVNLYDSSKVIICKATKEVVALCLHMEDSNIPLIMSLVVHPEHQGKGIGSYLLDHSINTSSKAYKMTRLSVISDNKAVSLYEHHGFQRGKAVLNFKFRSSK